MSLQLGQHAPDFTARTTAGDLRFHAWRDGAWAVLFSHPANFMPVCTTPLGEVARLKPAFEARGIKVIGLSVDALPDHKVWVGDIEQTQGVTVNFPLIADEGGKIARLYGMIHEATDPKLTVRSVVVIGPDGTVRATITYPPSAGRNFDEILRLVDSLQLTATQGLATPVNWRPGERVIITPSIDDDTARERFGEFDAPRPYLRYVDDPSRDLAATN